MKKKGKKKTEVPGEKVVVKDMSTGGSQKHRNWN